jgi:hypothetical protein
MPVTKLGRLVKDMKIKSLEEIYLFSLPIKVCLHDRLGLIKNNCVDFNIAYLIHIISVFFLFIFVLI